jgi:hypothetical protein
MRYVPERNSATGAVARSPAGQSHEFVRQWSTVNNGVPPLVEGDGLGEELGAIAVGLAEHGIDGDAH